MKFHIEEILHLAQSYTSYIKKLDITGNRILNIRLSYIPMTIGLKFNNFNNGVIRFEMAGNSIKRALVRTAIGIVLKKIKVSISRILSVSGDMVFIRINDFLNNEIPGLKGIQLKGFDIVDKEVIVLINKQSKRKK